MGAKGGVCSTFDCSCICFSCMKAKGKEDEEKEKNKVVKPLQTTSKKGIPTLHYLVEVTKDGGEYGPCFVCGIIKRPNVNILWLFGKEPGDIVAFCEDHQIILTEGLVLRWTMARRGMLPGAPTGSLLKNPSTFAETTPTEKGA